MFREQVITIMKEELSRHFSLEINQLSDSDIDIQLKYKNIAIGDKYTIEGKLKWYEDKGHGGGVYADGVKLIIRKS